MPQFGVLADLVPTTGRDLLRAVGALPSEIKRFRRLYHVEPLSLHHRHVHADLIPPLIPYWVLFAEGRRQRGQD